MRARNFKGFAAASKATHFRRATACPAHLENAPRLLPQGLNILVVEDHAGLVANLFDWFEPRGHHLDAAPDGLTGLQLVEHNHYDALIVDWMLPRLDGPSLVRKIREELRLDLPILMLTARHSIEDKLGGFQAGIDDYLTKPFQLAELEVRVQSMVVRHRGQRVQAELRVADLWFDLRAQRVGRGDRELSLFPAGRRLLFELMQASPSVVPRERLERALWGDAPPDADLLRSHIYELRQAIDAAFEHKLIQTVPRIGYRLCAQSPSTHHP